MRLPAIFRRRPAVQAPEDKPTRNRLFSTDVAFTRASPAVVAEGILASMRAAAPRMLAEDGTTDALDLSSAGTLSALGIPNIPETLFAWYGLQGFIGHQMAAIVAQHWLIDKACSMPARDAIRHGYDMKINTDAKAPVASKATPTAPPPAAAPAKDKLAAKQAEDIKAAIQKADRVYGVPRHMLEWIRKGRVFGIRVALFKIASTDPQFYDLPFNPDSVTPGSYEGIVQIDPYWLMPIFDGPSIQDPTSEGFYEPTWWQVNGKRYHKSHLAIFRTAPPPDILKASYRYGGVPIPQKIMERVYAAERTANEAPQLAMSKRLTVWNTDVAHLLANQDKFVKHMDNFMAYRDNFGVKINDTEDTMQQFDTTLAGLDDLTKTQYEIVAAASDVPITKLLGTTPKGFNSSGNYEEASYHEHLETIQDNDLTPFLDAHHIRLARSEIEPQFGLAPGALEILTEWEPLDSPTAKEYAEINYVKAQTADLYASAGAIDGQDIRDNIRGDKDSGYGNLSDDAPEPEADPTEGTVVPNAAKGGKIDAAG